MTECTVVLFCLDLVFILIARWSHLHQIRTKKLVLSALAVSLVFVTASLGLLALVKALGGSPLIFQYLSLVLLFVPAEIWLMKLIKKAPRS